MDVVILVVFKNLTKLGDSILLVGGCQQITLNRQRGERAIRGYMAGSGGQVRWADTVAGSSSWIPVAGKICLHARYRAPGSTRIYNMLLNITNKGVHMYSSDFNCVVICRRLYPRYPKIYRSVASSILKRECLPLYLTVDVQSPSAHPYFINR